MIRPSESRLERLLTKEERLILLELLPSSPALRASPESVTKASIPFALEAKTDLVLNLQGRALRDRVDMTFSLIAHQYLNVISTQQKVWSIDKYIARA